MKIHKNINDAKEACNRYLIKLDKLQEGEWGAIGVEMENIPLDNTENES